MGATATPGAYQGCLFVRKVGGPWSLYCLALPDPTLKIRKRGQASLAKKLYACNYSYSPIWLQSLIKFKRSERVKLRFEHSPILRPVTV